MGHDSCVLWCKRSPAGFKRTDETKSGKKKRHRTQRTCEKSRECNEQRRVNRISKIPPPPTRPSSCFVVSSRSRFILPLSGRCFNHHHHQRHSNIHISKHTQTTPLYMHDDGVWWYLYVHLDGKLPSVLCRIFTHTHTHRHTGVYILQA